MLPEAMTKFIRKHHVMTLAVSDPEGVWSAHCFYAYDAAKNWFVFTSDEETRHGNNLKTNNRVSVSIALETKIVGKIQGMQMSGKVIRPDESVYDIARSRYLKRFPYAVIMKTSFWIFIPEYAKMTDNAFGFGKKLIWPGND